MKMFISFIVPMLFIFIGCSEGSGDVINENTLVCKDKTPPIITLKGKISITLLLNQKYIEYGADAIDNKDGNISNFVKIDSSLLDISKEGTYSVIYSVVDKSGNKLSIKRVVKVVIADKTPPKFSLKGSDTITLLQNQAYIEYGATAVDDIDGNITYRIQIDNSQVDITIIGTYIVKYSIKDISGNEANITRIVNVISIDITFPQITLKGKLNITLFLNQKYIEYGATSTDNIDGNITNQIKIDSSKVDISKLGSYVVLYTIIDKAGNLSSVSRFIKVVNNDTISPVLVLIGNNVTSLLLNKVYTEYGATASDDIDGNITSQIKIDSSKVDILNVGKYIVKYSVKDKAGNETNITREIRVISSSYIVKTGQVASYNKGGVLVSSGTIKDDGFYNEGIYPNLSRLYNSIVLDNSTGLMWQDDIYARQGIKNWTDAKSYCANFTLGGYSDWRLPTPKELLYIVDNSKYRPAIQSGFINIIEDYYWSDTPYIGNPTNVWVVNFYNGFATNKPKNIGYYVRCIR